jgi:nucleotide-binding universal stress UspA family protein
MFGASLHLLHVIESPVVYGWEVYNPALVRDNVEKLAREQLGKVLTDAEIAKYRVELVTLAGSAFVEIVRYAREKDIDLIVMGTHGRGLIAHMLMGSVAEKVVRKAPCPVLTVRHPEHEFVMP